MTNGDIVEYVFRNYNIKRLITSMIVGSYNDKSYDDLEQYIYLYLLEYDNEKLNILFETKKLRNFISRMIRNQRNLPNHEYWNYKITSQNEVFFDCMEYEIDEYDSRCDKIFQYIEDNCHTDDTKIDNNGYTKEEINRIFMFNIFKKYILGMFRQNKLAINLRISRPVISNSIKYVKQDIREWWNKNEIVDKDLSSYYSRQKYKNMKEIIIKDYEGLFDWSFIENDKRYDN